MKFYGKVFFVKSEVDETSVAREVVTPVTYRGEILRNRRSIISSDRIVNDFTIQNEVSIVADKFMKDNYAWIKYVEWRGNNWTVTNVDINFPRVNLTLGGLYNA